MSVLMVHTVLQHICLDQCLFVIKLAPRCLQSETGYFNLSKHSLLITVIISPAVTGHAPTHQDGMEAKYTVKYTANVYTNCLAILPLAKLFKSQVYGSSKIELCFTQKGAFLVFPRQSLCLNIIYVLPSYVYIIQSLHICQQIQFFRGPQ